MIIYFSGTGNSRYAAALLADRLGDQLLDAGACMKEGKKVEITSEKPWVFVSPTYAWQLPRVFESFIRNGIYSGSREAYFVMTCGNEIGNPEKEIQRLCRVKGFVFRGVLEVVMPENYVAMFAVPEAEEAAAIVEKARPVLEAGAEQILKGEPFPERSSGTLARLKSTAANSVFYSTMVKAKAFYATDACSGCGLCEKACPLNNIRMEDGKPCWGNDCTHCMACICSCPLLAIEYGKKSQGKPRYQCPEYQG